LTAPNTKDHLGVGLDQSTPGEGRAEFFHRAALTREAIQLLPLIEGLVVPNPDSRFNMDFILG